MANKVNAVPEGYHTVTPYLRVHGVAKLMKFATQAFGAKELFRHALPEGSIMHAEMKIGDSIVMLADANAQAAPMPASICLYVEDCDRLYQQAIAAGATSLRELATQFYGDRSGGVKDAFGNEWWISTHVEDVSPQELERRMKAMK